MLVAGWANEEAVAAYPTPPAVPAVLALGRPPLASLREMLPTRRVSENPA